MIVHATSLITIALSITITGALPDQTAYLATVNELNRFFTRFPTLKNVLSANDQQYNRVPIQLREAGAGLARAGVERPAGGFGRRGREEGGMRGARERHGGAAGGRRKSERAGKSAKELLRTREEEK